jgi:hypothetical protein
MIVENADAWVSMNKYNKLWRLRLTLKKGTLKRGQATFSLLTINA